MVNSCRNVYFLKKEDGQYKVGTIISDKSVKVVGFSEDINVSSAGMIRFLVKKSEAQGVEAQTNKTPTNHRRLVCARGMFVPKRHLLGRFHWACGDYKTVTPVVQEAPPLCRRSRSSECVVSRLLIPHKAGINKLE